MTWAIACFAALWQENTEAAIVHETEKSIAVRDISPKAPVHVLVIPKEHIDNLMAVESRHAEVIADMYQTVQQVARSEGASENGFRLVVNNGKNAGQAVGICTFTF